MNRVHRIERDSLCRTEFITQNTVYCAERAVDHAEWCLSRRMGFITQNAVYRTEQNLLRKT